MRTPPPQARALRHIAHHRNVGALQRVLGLLQSMEYATHVGGPGLLWVALERRAQVELVDGVLRVQRQHMHLAVAARSQVHCGLAIDSAGQDKAAVVVGVFTDQVHPAGRARQVAGSLAKVRFELGQQRGEHVLPRLCVGSEQSQGVCDCRST